MSKVKSDKIPHYELLYLISNKYAENELDPVKAKVAKLVANRGGQITYTTSLGKKRLAYAIKGFRYGYYELVEFDMPGIELLKLENDLRLDTEVLRHQVVRKVALTAEQMQAEQEAVDKRLAAIAKSNQAPEIKKEEVKAETKEEVKEEVKAENTEVAEVKETVEPATEAVQLDSDKDLDKKLDNILESDILYK
jgi:small subunit ribosomal protein S6